MGESILARTAGSGGEGIAFDFDNASYNGNSNQTFTVSVSGDAVILITISGSPSYTTWITYIGGEIQFKSTAADSARKVTSVEAVTGGLQVTYGGSGYAKFIYTMPLS